MCYHCRFVNIVYTSSTYGSPGREAFEAQINNNENFCTDLTFSLDDLTDIDNVARRLINSSANVVVCFCTDFDAERVLNRVNDFLKSSESRDHIVWLASDAWATSETIAEGIEPFVHGYFGITPMSNIVEDFSDYFESLNPYTITHDPWFCGYFSERYNCNYTNDSNSAACPKSIRISEPDFIQNSFIAFIYDATYAFAYALDKVLKDNCRVPYSIVDQQCLAKSTNEYISLGGVILRQALQNVNFTSPITNNRVLFDSMGNGIPIYSVSNYQQTGNNTYRLKNVGLWDEGLENRLNISLPVQFGPNSSLHSYCNGIDPCEPGTSTDYTESRCCWICNLCRANTFSTIVLSPNCTTCPEGQWGVNPLGPNTACAPIPIFEINFNHPLCYLLLPLATLGFCVYVAITIIYFVKWNSPVVKASGREHCILILIGAGIAFPLTLFACAKPTYPTCIIFSLFYWFSVSMLIFPLLAKVIKIVRIFVLTKKKHDLRFLEWPWQILFATLPVVAVECVVIIGYSTRPQVVTEGMSSNGPLPPTIQRSCDQLHLGFGAFLYAVFIISALLLLVFAIITRNYPKNFRESVHIMYASFGLSAVILANGIVYFILLSNNLKPYLNLVNSLILIIIAGVILLSFFGPRVFFIITGKIEETIITTTLERNADSDVGKHLQMKTMNKITSEDPFAKYQIKEATNDSKLNT